MIPVGILGGAVKAGAAPLVGTYRSVQFLNLGGGTVFTFNSLAIGAAAADRYVAVTWTTQAFAGSSAPTSVTIGGVSATMATGSYAGTASFQVSTWYALVPSGTTATVVVTMPQAHLRGSLGVWTINGTINTVSAGTFTGAWSSGTGPNATVTGASGGFIVAGLLGELNRSYTWVNATERADASPDGSRSHTVADATTVGSTNISATPSLSGNYGLTVCAFGG